MFIRRYSIRRGLTRILTDQKKQMIASLNLIIKSYFFKVVPFPNSDPRLSAKIPGAVPGFYLCSSVHICGGFSPGRRDAPQFKLFSRKPS